MTPDVENGNSQLFEDVWQKAISKIDNLTEEADDRRFLKSLVMGGTVAAESVISHCHESWVPGGMVPLRLRSQLQLRVTLWAGSKVNWCTAPPGWQDGPFVQ